MPIKLDVSLIVLAGYFILTGGGLLSGILYTIALLLAVLLHELGHVAAGVVFGSRTRDVTLMFFGGCATMYNMPREPWKEAVIAAAGPAAGGLLWFVCPILTTLTVPISGILASLIFFVGSISGWLALFNLIPAYPMDGGRIFRSLLSYYKGHMWATRISCKIAFGLAVVMGLLGLMRLNVFLMIIAFFIWSSARNELQMLRYWNGDDDDTIIISPPPYGGQKDYTKINRKR